MPPEPRRGAARAITSLQNERVKLIRSLEMRKVRREFNCRHIAAARQRVACADRSEKFAIEIFRIVFTETARCVGQDR